MKFRHTLWLLPLALIFAAVLCLSKLLRHTPQPDLVGAERRARHLCQKMGLSFPPPNRKVIVLKSQRKLLLLSGKRVLKEYKVALSYNPVGDKEREGDGKVPEGEFFVCDKHPSRNFHLFIGISYPSIEDAERGLKQGLINRRQYGEIVGAIRDKKRPPWNTPLGGEIGLHGGGTHSDWTIGCIALENSDIEELYVVLRHGDPVLIKP
ncbi:MAG: L,D-transpeptidase family protein [Armatimonadota bacterium]|nr:L,D-transpeptidase family protein [Armatimonadota bacterium]MDW8026516.1 L,D-transpeptidase family protein [Armatimonadota bacterium]